MKQGVAFCWGEVGWLLRLHRLFLAGVAAIATVLASLNLTHAFGQEWDLDPGAITQGSGVGRSDVLPGLTDQCDGVQVVEGTAWSGRRDAGLPSTQGRGLSYCDVRTAILREAKALGHGMAVGGQARRWRRELVEWSRG